MDALVLENVSKSFGAVEAVKSLRARVPAGTIYGFLGPNGAGKTTTIRMIMKIILPDSGRIEILGRDAAGVARERIGYMPEERGLYRKMKVRSVLSFIGSIKGMNGRALEQAIDRWLERVGLSEWENKRVEELSRGMQQKIQFITTVINDPEILILDEPFSGLDPVNLDLMRDIMLEMNRAGKTVIFSTHMMDHAERLCDSILLINRGENILEGRVEDLRGAFGTNTVRVEIEGDASFLDDLPMVESNAPSGRAIEVFLKEDADSREFLRAVVERADVRSFEHARPSLHEIFVQQVKHSDG